LAASGATFIVTVRTDGTVVVTPTAEMATVAIPATTNLTAGECQFLSVLCRMGFSLS